MLMVTPSFQDASYEPIANINFLVSNPMNTVSISFINVINIDQSMVVLADCIL